MPSAEPIMETSFDTFLWYLLYYKIILVMLMSIPLQWLFGIKKPLLRWVSKSLIVRVYMAVAPPVSFVLALYLSYSFKNATLNIDSTNSIAARAEYDLIRARAYLGWFNTLFFFLIRRLYELVRGDPEPLFAVEMDTLRRDMLNFKPPPLWLLLFLTFFWRTINPPSIKGLENLPKDKKKIMFVGNHTIWALDSPLLFIMLYKETGIYIRGLAEHFWFVIPLLNEITTAFGGIDGTRDNCDLLMRQGQPLLVYPGGVREAFKKKGEKKYEMLWGNHTGFARMAIKHGYTLVPVSSIGTEDMWKILIDVPVGWLMRAGKKGMGGKSLTAPLIRPPMPWDLQKIYFRLGEPIETAHLNGDCENEKNLTLIRDIAQQRIQQGIQTLLKERDFDERRFVFSSSKVEKKSK